MQITDACSVNWSRLVPSKSNVRDALGLWSHLSIQTEFTAGITSVTDRMRYYTLMAWYWEHLAGTTKTKDFEKIFILSCLAHHNGESEHPALLHVFDKRKFRKDWHQRSKFTLDFDINGFGKTYYNAQLEVLACAWTDDFGDAQLSPINRKLAACLNKLDSDAFLQKEFDKSALSTDFPGLCICDSLNNEQEIEIMSKLFFGFFSGKDGIWDLDEQEFNQFMHGRQIELDFHGGGSNVSDVVFGGSDRREKSLKRRSTLFLFLKIINETIPLKREVWRTLWDAVYFSQNRETKDNIAFGRLEEIRKVWEFFHLNVYYVHAIESILDVAQQIIRKNPGIARNAIVESMNVDKINTTLQDALHLKKQITSIGMLLSEVSRKSTRLTSLNSPINESIVFDGITNSQMVEAKLAYILLMLALLQGRLVQISDEIKGKSGSPSSRPLMIEDQLEIQGVLNALTAEKAQSSISEYVREMIDIVIDRHLLESATRLSGGTKNWIFTEEEGMLTPARRDPIRIEPRDNRWKSIYNLLTDTKFIEDDSKTNRVVLTEKGKQWLSKIE